MASTNTDTKQAASKTPDKTSKWLFIDETGNQSQPQSYSDMYQLLAQDVIGASTFAWTEGMPEWLPLHKIPLWTASGLVKPPTTPAASTADTSASSSDASSTPASGWLYYDNYRVQKGPVTEEKLRELFLAAEINEHTFGWHAGMDEWKQLGQLEALKPTVFASVPDAQSTASAMDTTGDTKSSEAPPTGDSAGSTSTSTAPTADNNNNNNNNSSSSSSSNSAATNASDAASGAAGANTSGNEQKSGNKKEKTEEEKKLQRERKKKKKKRKKGQTKWKQVASHNNVYVQGLPEDITEDEMKDHFKKCGIIKEDFHGKPRIKIYKDKQGKPKGDALVTYLKPESVALAEQILDGSSIRADFVIKVEKAVFKMAGDKFDPSKRPKIAKEALAVAKKKPKQDNKLSWNDGIETTPKLKIVILKNMFRPSEAVGDSSFYDDLKLEVGLQIEKEIGKIEKITVFNDNPIGPIAVRFKQGVDAEKCIEVMNGRFFGGRKIECEYFDGVTNYKVGESQEEMEKRHKAFGDWLESQEDN